MVTAVQENERLPKSGFNQLLLASGLFVLVGGVLYYLGSNTRVAGQSATLPRPLILTSETFTSLELIPTDWKSVIFPDVEDLSHPSPDLPNLRQIAPPDADDLNLPDIDSVPILDDLPGIGADQGRENPDLVIFQINPDTMPPFEQIFIGIPPNEEGKSEEIAQQASAMVRHVGREDLPKIVDEETGVEVALPANGTEEHIILVRKPEANLLAESLYGPEEARRLGLAAYFANLNDPDEIKNRLEEALATINVARQARGLPEFPFLTVRFDNQDRIIDPNQAWDLANASNIPASAVVIALSANEIEIVGLEAFGSVSQGMAQPGISDIDYRIVVRSPDDLIRVRQILSSEEVQAFINGTLTEDFKQHFTGLDLLIHLPQDRMGQTVGLDQAINQHLITRVEISFR